MGVNSGVRVYFIVFSKIKCERVEWKKNTLFHTHTHPKDWACSCKWVCVCVWERERESERECDRDKWKLGDEVEKWERLLSF